MLHEDDWRQQVDQYIAQPSEAEFSHGVYRKCSDKLHAGLACHEDIIKSGEIPSS